MKDWWLKKDVKTVSYLDRDALMDKERTLRALKNCGSKEEVIASILASKPADKTRADHGEEDRTTLICTGQHLWPDKSGSSSKKGWQPGEEARAEANAMNRNAEEEARVLLPVLAPKRSQ